MTWASAGRMTFTAWVGSTPSTRCARGRRPVDENLPDVPVLPHSLKRLGGPLGREHRVYVHLQYPGREARKDFLPELRHQPRLLSPAAAAQRRADQPSP